MPGFFEVLLKGGTRAALTLSLPGFSTLRIKSLVL